MATNEDYTSRVPYYTFPDTLEEAGSSIGDESADATAQRLSENV